MTEVDRNDLRRWRFKSPGVIASLCVAPLAWHLGVFALDEKLVWSVLVPAFGLLVSFVYEALYVRGPLWKEETNEYVGKQIKSKIIALIPPELNVTDREREFLRDNEITKRLTGVFWEAIDADEQLKSHKEAFYNNGKYYTTAFDLVIICGPLGFIYLVGLDFEQSAFYLITSVALLSVAMFAWYCLIPILRARHLAFSVEQLDQLQRRQAAFVNASFVRLVAEIRRGPDMAASKQ